MLAESGVLNDGKWSDPLPSTLPLAIAPCETRESRHFVQFYENDAFLVESVAEFIGGGVGAGHGAIVIATQPHRESLEERLEAQGIDVAAGKARGQYVPLDAAQTLAMFMIHGMPDPELFSKAVGPLVAGAAKGRRGLRAFGEMVAVLFAKGNGPAAIRMEELWNELAKVHAFSLFCAYPIKGFEGEVNGEVFRHICQEHTRVIPAESYAARHRTDDERLRTIACLQQKAASLEMEILERQRAEEQLREAKENLAKANEALELRVAERTARLQETVSELEAFSYSVSHDMRSPLRAMQAYATILLKDYGKKLDAEGLAYLERINRASVRLDLLIRDVLAYSKVSKGQIEMKPLELGPVIEDVIRERFETRRGCIKVEEPLHMVAGHQAHVTQCLSNLLDNAMKFVAPGTVPQVRVRTEAAGGKVTVKIRDNGVGIRPEHYGRIFQMFGRVYSEKTYEGTGIGLCIVKKAVARMGGEAGFNSEPGRGSEFWFTLPRGTV